nr:MAG TPA: hypothetical protein [Caudoviricetes sp.]
MNEEHPAVYDENRKSSYHIKLYGLCDRAFFMVVGHFWGKYYHFLFFYLDK